MGSEAAYNLAAQFGHLPQGLWQMNNSSMTNLASGLSALTSGGGAGTSWGQPSILPGVSDGYSVYHSSTSSAIGTHADDALLDVATACTIGCWFKPDTLYAFQTLLYRQDTFNLIIDTSHAASDVARTAGNVIVPGELYFIVSVDDGTNNRLYVNGALVAVAATTMPNNTANAFYFGTNPSFGGVNGAVGYLQYPMFYKDIALTAAQIRALYEIGMITNDEAADHSILAMPYSRDALASDVDRTYALFSNGSDVDVWIKKGTDARVGEGVLLPPRERHRIENYTGAISVIADSRMGGKLVGIETG